MCDKRARVGQRVTLNEIVQSQIYASVSSLHTVSAISIPVLHICNNTCGVENLQLSDFVFSIY